MKKLSSLLLVLIFCNCSGNSQQKEDSDYISEVNAFFKTLNNERKNNYLQLIALYPLKEGSNTFGKDSLNDLICTLFYQSVALVCDKYFGNSPVCDPTKLHLVYAKNSRY